MIWWRWIAKKLCLLEYVLAVTSGCNINMFLSVFWAQKNFYYPFTEQLLFRNRKSVYCRETTINVHVILNGDFRVWLYTFSYGIVKIFGFFKRVVAVVVCLTRYDRIWHNVVNCRVQTVDTGNCRYVSSVLCSVDRGRCRVFAVELPVTRRLIWDHTRTHHATGIADARPYSVAGHFLKRCLELHILLLFRCRRTAIGAETHQHFACRNPSRTARVVKNCSPNGHTRWLGAADSRVGRLNGGLETMFGVWLTHAIDVITVVAEPDCWRQSPVLRAPPPPQRRHISSRPLS